MNKGLQVLVVVAFCATGALYTAGGEEVSPMERRYMQAKAYWNKQSRPVQAVVATASVATFAGLLFAAPHVWRAFVRPERLKSGGL